MGTDHMKGWSTDGRRISYCTLVTLVLKITKFNWFRTGYRKRILWTEYKTFWVGNFLTCWTTISFSWKMLYVIIPISFLKTSETVDLYGALKTGDSQTLTLKYIIN